MRMHAFGCTCTRLKVRKFETDKISILSFLEMARTKNTERKTGLVSNPFKKVNMHGVELLDVGKVQHMCELKGKDACSHTRVCVHLM